jgi:hypothetical protein
MSRFARIGSNQWLKLDEEDDAGDDKEDDSHDKLDLVRRIDVRSHASLYEPPSKLRRLLIEITAHVILLKFNSHSIDD